MVPKENTNTIGHSWPLTGTVDGDDSRRSRLTVLAGVSLVVLAVAIRLGLLLMGWPETNSDESTFGLMALHIVQGRDRPVFFYGQNYMGSGEAWVGAGLFGLIGPSLVALRLPLVAMYAGFLIVVWYLGELLNGRRPALVGTLLLALGSAELLTEQLRAGSRVELLLAGSCMAWLSAWLVMRGQLVEPWRQGAAAAGWGLSAGYGLWTDLLTAPWALATGMLLAFCWRPRRPRLAAAPVIAGLLVGALPQLLRHTRVRWGQDDAITVVFNQRGYQAGAQSAPLADRVIGTVTVALPHASNGTALTRAETIGPWLETSGAPQVALCAWGVGLLAMLALAAWQSLGEVCRAWSGTRRELPAAALARLTVLSSVALTVAIFATSPRAAHTPVASARYLLGVLIAVPVVVGSIAAWACTARRRRACGLAIAIVLGVLALDTVAAYRQALALRRADSEQSALVTSLLHRGATRVWTDYWTCHRLVFESRERIVCGSLDGGLALHDNRYGRYLQAVEGDSRAPYLFPASSPQASRLHQQGRSSVPLPDGYVIFN
jgi:hypothetical protein